jgi:hypothetical protein
MREEPREQSAPKGITRREFARRAALASAVAAVAPTGALTSPSPSFPPNEHASVAAADLRGHLSDSSSKVALSAEQQPSDLPKLSPESHAEVEARVQAILSQYGSRFNEAQKADLRRLCNLAQPPLDRLRAYALDNGDAPALYLKPLVEREKNPLENTRVGKTPAASRNPKDH